MNERNASVLLRALRQRAGLTQEHIALKLGISRPKYVNLEAGKTELSLSEIKLLADFYEISPSEIVEGKLAPSESIVSNFTDNQLIYDEPTIVPREIDPQVNPSKLKNILLYILSKVGALPNVGETVLYKLLYFVDFDYYEKHGRSITGLVYIKNHYGPTPAREFVEVVEHMKTAGELEVVETSYFSHLQKKYLPIKRANLSSLSADEIKHIDSELDRLADKTAAELSELSHKDMPWIAAKSGKRIDYQLVMYRTDETSIREHDDDL
jgi:transcriptional regulator with XRE-family HTH domain